MLAWQLLILDRGSIQTSWVDLDLAAGGCAVAKCCALPCAL